MYEIYSIVLYYENTFLFSPHGTLFSSRFFVRKGFLKFFDRGKGCWKGEALAAKKKCLSLQKIGCASEILASKLARFLSAFTIFGY